MEKRKGELQKAQGMNVVSREKRRRSVWEKGRIRAGSTQREGKQEGGTGGQEKGRRYTVATQEKGSREAEGRHGWRQEEDRRGADTTLTRPCSTVPCNN